MILKKQSLINYRNIKEITIYPDKNLTVICGKNGQGKTNLLESIWMLSGAKNFRGNKDIELVKKGEEFAVITAECEEGRKKETFNITIGGEECEKKGRNAKINGVDYGRATNIAGNFYSVVFAPIHLSLISGSPEKRRKFIDAALCQIYPAYISVYKRYTRAVTQKNALLKADLSYSEKIKLVETFNQEISVSGEAIIKYRVKYLEGLFKKAEETYDNISSNSERCVFKYNPMANTASEIYEILNQSVKIDLAAGFSTKGPHRDDINIEIKGDDAKSFASQGQQRSAALSLKLAEAGQIAEIAQVEPVLLLDDVLSELDSTRQNFLLEKAEGRQTIITSCNPAFFDGRNASIIVMENGNIINL